MLDVVYLGKRKLSVCVYLFDIMKRNASLDDIQLRAYYEKTRN